MQLHNRQEAFETVIVSSATTAFYLHKALIARPLVIQDQMKSAIYDHLDRTVGFSHQNEDALARYFAQV